MEKKTKKERKGSRFDSIVKASLNLNVVNERFRLVKQKHEKNTNISENSRKD